MNKANSRRRYVKYKSTWYMFWNISMILACVWLRNVGFENLLIRFNNIFVQLFFLFLIPIFNLIFKLIYDTSLTLEANSEVYSEPCKTTRWRFLQKLMNSFWFFAIFAKSSILDVWKDFESASEASNDLRNNLDFRCLTDCEFVFVVINYFHKLMAIFY